jgi:hypothetical protein
MVARGTSGGGVEKHWLYRRRGCRGTKVGGGQDLRALLAAGSFLVAVAALFLGGEAFSGREKAATHLCFGPYFTSPSLFRADSEDLHG